VRAIRATDLLRCRMRSCSANYAPPQLSSAWLDVPKKDHVMLHVIKPISSASAAWCRMLKGRRTRPKTHQASEQL